MEGALLRTGAAVLLAAVPLVSQGKSPFATKVIAFDTKGRKGGGIFDPRKALGRPGGWADVHSLGIGGWLTLGFDVRIQDGPGADLIVSENPFHSGCLPCTFAETCFVEVSSNGKDFARLPNAYYGPNRWPGAFGVVNAGAYAGLGGVLPVRAKAADPRDVVEAGGDAFDLADLRGHPLVKAGKLDLNAVTQVRLVDVVDGVSRDTRGVVIRDAGTGSADIDAVTAIHHSHESRARGPSVSLRIPVSGDFELTIADPDGLADLDPASWRVALWGRRIDPADLLAVSRVTKVSATSFTLRLGGTLPGGFLLQMAVSIKDRAGHRSGASRSRPLR